MRVRGGRTEGPGLRPTPRSRFTGARARRETHAAPTGGELFACGDRPLFVVPPKNDAVRLIRADLAAAKVGDADRVDFHAFRHTFVSLLARQNIRPEILQKLARHRDIKTTIGYYTHWRPDDERAELERL